MNGAPTRPDVSQRPLCLVTGGATGFGFALAQAFAAANCDVVLSGDGSIELELAAEELMLLVPELTVHPLIVDLARDAGAPALHRKLLALGRPIDILVANTSVGAWGDFGRSGSLDDELATLHINALSVLHLVRLLTQQLTSRGGGQLVLASSPSADSCAFDTLHAATRALTAALSEGLARELAPSGVCVTSLMPGVEADGPCLRLLEPLGLIALAEATRARALARSDLLSGRAAVVSEDMQARYERYLRISADSPRA